MKCVQFQSMSTQTYLETRPMKCMKASKKRCKELCTCLRMNPNILHLLVPCTEIHPKRHIPSLWNVCSFRACQLNPIWRHGQWSVWKPPRRDTRSFVLAFAWIATHSTCWYYVLKSTQMDTFHRYEMFVVSKHINPNLSGHTDNQVFESLQEEIQGALYLPSHESQPTRLAGTMYWNPPKWTHSTAMKCL